MELDVEWIDYLVASFSYIIFCVWQKKQSKLYEVMNDKMTRRFFHTYYISSKYIRYK